MKLILNSLSRYKKHIFIAIFIKLMATVFELALPYILEHIIDYVVPSGNMISAVVWGLTMFVAALFCRFLNVRANRKAVDNAHKISYETRQKLFVKTVNLSGRQFDEFTLPSLISRMTSDSYNMQGSVQQFQTLCVRAPIMMIGGVAVSLFMDAGLALILVCMIPILLGVIITVSYFGIPMYRNVQKSLDKVVRIMRENITGIRVIKALSKEESEKKRYDGANRELTSKDIRATTVMALPGPFMQLCLNIGLTVVVIVGAGRVNEGIMKPGVILAFLTYVNMIAMGIMGINRIFITMSKASASADRIAAVLDTDVEQEIIDAYPPENDNGEIIRFDNVSFGYEFDRKGNRKDNVTYMIRDIDFSLKRGESLGIIGPTGCGKTTIINLLMHFYDATEGRVIVDGRDVRSYDKDELRSRFGTVFQNDMIFMDSLYENISFGRDPDDESIKKAIDSAMASEFIDSLPDGLDHMATIKGANLSGGQKQRILVARALAASPEIIVLDDSSSALDYKTDSKMRNNIMNNYRGSTIIMIAQRISSVKGMDKIIVMDKGNIIGFGDHETLMKECEIYRDTYEIQMGDIE